MKVDVTRWLRLAAEATGIDYQKLLAEAQSVIKSLPMAR